MHTLWIHEVRKAFRPACSPDASVWDRARAVTYLRERLTPRFRAEREAATSLVRVAPAREAQRTPGRGRPGRDAGSSASRGLPPSTRRRRNSAPPREELVQRAGRLVQRARRRGGSCARGRPAAGVSAGSAPAEDGAMATGEGVAGACSIVHAPAGLERVAEPDLGTERRHVVLEVVPSPDLARRRSPCRAPSTPRPNAQCFDTL